MSAVWSLSAGNRTWWLRAPTSEFDPKATFARLNSRHSEPKKDMGNTRASIRAARHMTQIDLMNFAGPAS